MIQNSQYQIIVKIFFPKKSSNVSSELPTENKSVSDKSGKSTTKSSPRSVKSQTSNHSQVRKSNHGSVLLNKTSVDSSDSSVEENQSVSSGRSSVSSKTGRSSTSKSSPRSVKSRASNFSQDQISNHSENILSEKLKEVNDNVETISTVEVQNGQIKKVKKKSKIKLSSSEKIEELYDFGKKLGDGNFAVVKEGFDKETKIKYALKIIDGRKVRGKEEMLENEISIQRESSHPNIVQLFHDYHSPTEIFLVMELVSGGDFFDLVAQNIKFDEEEATLYVRDLCSGLDYLHQRKIVHRDIKPENLMVS